MNPEQLLAAAEKALARGVSLEDISQRIAERSNFSGIKALRAAVQSQNQTDLRPEPVRPDASAIPRPSGPREEREVDPEALQRFAQHSPVSQFLRTLAEGATFGGADEIAGALGGNRAKSRQRMADIREVNPGTAAVVEGGAEMLLPTGIAGRAVAKGKGFGRTVALTTAAAAGGGAASGALRSEGDAGERALAAVEGAEQAAPFGLLLGVGGAAANRATRRFRSGRSTRVADDLDRTTGLGPVDINRIIDEGDEAVARIRVEAFAPLEELGAIPNAALRELLEKPEFAKELKRVAPETLGANRTRSPSFLEMQEVLGRLKDKTNRGFNQGKPNSARKFKALSQELQSEMEAQIPGFHAANEAIRDAERVRRAVKQGTKASLNNAARVDRAMRGMGPAERRAFNQARLREITRRLRLREDGAVAPLRQMLNAGPETQNVLRTLFPTQEAFEEFSAILRHERRASKVTHALERLAIPVATGVAAGAGFGLIRSLRSGGDTGGGGR